MDPRLHAKGQSKVNDCIGYVKTFLKITSKIYVQKIEPKQDSYNHVFITPLPYPATLPFKATALYNPKKSTCMHLDN